MTVQIVLNQHAENAAILWLQRDRAVGQPHYGLADLARLDDRLEAHLDGLRIGGDAAWAICEEELRWGGPGEVFAAAVLALERGESRAAGKVLAACRAWDLARALVSAIGWLPAGRVAAVIDRLLAEAPPLLRRVGIAASAAHRRDPGRALLNALEDPDLSVRSCALRAAGRLGGADFVPRLERHLASDDPGCRFSAAWSVALLTGREESVRTLKVFVERCAPQAEAALAVVLRRIDVGDGLAWLADLAADPRTARFAAVGAGVLGLPDSVPWLIDTMRVAELARVAGEAFCAVTGADLVAQDLEGERPRGFVAGPSDDPQDENVALDPDENVPWPDGEKTAQWWRRNRERFPSGVRHLLGKPLDREWLHAVLRNGGQRQRAAAALESAIRNPGQPLFEVRAPGFRQRELLGLK